MGIFSLPEGYAEIKRVNLQTDIKLALLVNAGALIISVALLFIGNIFVPFFENIVENSSLALWQAIGLLLAIILYMVAHELVHGLFIKKYSGEKAKYGFTGLYAYAGSDAYFNKSQYIVIALSPVVLFGIGFLLLNIFLPKEWFWFAYFIQVLNFSGAAGDIYITGLMGKLPKDVLTKDEGIEMVIYSRTQ